MTPEPDTAVHPTAIEEAAAEAPGAVAAGEAVAKDVAAGRVPSEAEQAEAERYVSEAVALAPQVVKETKAGYKTTEFWLTGAVALLTLLGTFPLPPKFEAIVAAGLAASYSISRGLAKLGVPNVQDPGE